MTFPRMIFFSIFLSATVFFTHKVVLPLPSMLTAESIAFTLGLLHFMVAVPSLEGVLPSNFSASVPSRLFFRWTIER